VHFAIETESYLELKHIEINTPSARIGHIRILGIGLELACKRGSCGGISLKRDEYHLHLKRLPRISLSFKLVPGQYREYEYGLLFS